MSTEAKQETWIPIPMQLAWRLPKTEGKSPMIDKLKIKNYKMCEETIYHKQELREKQTEGLAALSTGVSRTKNAIQKEI